MSRLRSSALALGTILLPLFSAAQIPKMEPGEAHRRLDFLVGEWTVQSRMHMPERVHQAEHATEVLWLPGGVWLEERTEMADTPLGSMYGSARIAWDERAGEYVRYWIDNQSHVVLPMRGNFVDETTLELEGFFTWIDGRVFHQRLVIRATDEGWSQTGYMGVDPDRLRLNHEDVAMRRAPAASAAPPRGDHDPPDWFLAHLAFLTKGSGRWIADNAAYRSEEEPFDAYGTEWRRSIDDGSITGRLFGLVDGEERGNFWEFRIFWHPGEGRALTYQFGASGALGVGAMQHSEAGHVRSDQEFVTRDGTRNRVGHDLIEKPDGSHLTTSYDIRDDGTWTPRRTYTWRREQG